MTVVCKMANCPYHGKNGFCLQPIKVSIDQNGMCSTIWIKGQPRVITKEDYDAATEVISITRTGREEEAGSRQEDPQDGAAAYINEQTTEKSIDEEQSRVQGNGAQGGVQSGI